MIVHKIKKRNRGFLMICCIAICLFSVDDTFQSYSSSEQQQYIFISAFTKTTSSYQTRYYQKILYRSGSRLDRITTQIENDICLRNKPPPPPPRLIRSSTTIRNEPSSSSFSSPQSLPIKKLVDTSQSKPQRLSAILQETNEQQEKQQQLQQHNPHSQKSGMNNYSSTAHKNGNDANDNGAQHLLVNNRFYDNENNNRNNKNKRKKKFINQKENIDPIDRGPYADFTIKELSALTEKILSPFSSPLPSPLPSPLRSTISLNQEQEQHAQEQEQHAQQQETSIPSKMSPQQLHEISRLMSSWSKRKVVNSGIMTERLLNRLIDEKMNGNKRVNLTPVMFHMAITAWLNSGFKSDAFQAASIFEKMIALYKNEITNTETTIKPTPTDKRNKLMINGKPFPIPNAALCNIVLESLAKCKSKKSALYCESILNQLEKLPILQQQQQQQGKDAKSNTNTATTVNTTVTETNTSTIHDNLLTPAVTTHITTRTIDTALPIASTDLDIAMERRALKTTKPNIRTYNAAMNAWAQAQRSSSGEHSEQILLKVLDLYQSTKDPFIQPNQKSFNIVIHAWAKCQCKGSAKRAEQILQRMEDLYRSGEYTNNIKPDSISFTSVLTALANSGEKHESAQKAEELLERMERLYYEEKTKAKLDDEESLLWDDNNNEGGWYDESGISSEDEKHWPDTIAYNAVLNVYAKSDEPDVGERCELLFQKMEYLYRMGNVNVKPDLVSYNSLINVIASKGTPAGAHRAGEILDRMEQLYREGDDSVKPDVVTYNSVIKAYSNSGEATAAQTAENILIHMEAMHEEDERNVQPDTYTYNTVIHSWANSGDQYAAERAEFLLNQMSIKYSEGNHNLKPTVVSYNSVLNALSKSNDQDAPQRSERLLKQMIDLYNRGDKSVKPDVFSFCTAINTWSKSQELDKAHKAIGLLRQMQGMRIRPNVFVYTAILNACAYTFGDEKQKQNAMKIVVDTWEELKRCDYCRANHVTYATFFKACSNLMADIDSTKKDALVSNVWRQSVNEGQVGQATLAVFEKAASPALYKSLVGEYLTEGALEVSIQDLPMKWVCNVREKRYRKNHPGKRSSTHRIK